MVELLKYEIVSPEKKVASGEAESILVPGYEGDFTVLSNHAAYLSTLRHGILKIFQIQCYRSLNHISFWVTFTHLSVHLQGNIYIYNKKIK